MPRGRKPKVWWWQERQCYYATVASQRHRLGPDKREAERQLHELLAQKPAVQQNSTLEMCDRFLSFCHDSRAPRTYQWYRDYVQSFVDYLRSAGLRPALNGPETVSAKDVRRWLARHGAAKRQRIIAIKRCWNWGYREGWMSQNPLRGLESPPAKSRTEEWITPEEFFWLLVHVSDHEFFRMLVVSWETGARPQEVKPLEARHLDLEQHRAVIPRSETKGKRRPRVLYLTERAERILRELARERQHGPLFLNQAGRPWSASAVRLRFQRLAKHVGKQYCQTLFRHSWITRKLLAGEDSHVVAALAGHVDSSMIDRYYSKVSGESKFLLDAMRRK